MSQSIVIDTFAGLVPAKIISVAPDRKTAVVEFTATRGAYKKGDRERVARRTVVPKDAVHVRSGNYRIWAHESPLDSFERVEEPASIRYGDATLGSVARDAVRNPARKAARGKSYSAWRNPAKQNPMGSWFVTHAGPPISNPAKCNPAASSPLAILKRLAKCSKGRLEEGYEAVHDRWFFAFPSKTAAANFDMTAGMYGFATMAHMPPLSSGGTWVVPVLKRKV
jgi:hypothetical protein